MNRQILFRGKTLDEGEWIEGYLVQGQWYCDDKLMTVIIPTDITFYPRCEISGYEDVDPETVGQWTGLVDKNGKKIFEGDIVKYRDLITNQEKIALVEWNETRASYIILRRSLMGLQYLYIDEPLSARCEVIGNNWDNPELLEE